MAELHKPPAPPAPERPAGPAASPETASPAPGGWVARLEAFVGEWRSRRARDARLLDLGALVFELHRQGRREPELLRARAAAVEAVTPAGEPGANDHMAEGLPDDIPRCLDCQAALAPNQLACLRCGSRVAPGEPRPDRLPLLGLATAVVLVGLVCFGFALSELTSDDAPVAARDDLVLGVADPDAGRNLGGGANVSAGGRGAVAGYTAAGDGAEAADAAGARPAGERYAVVLVTSSDGNGARRVAQEAARSGLEVDLLRSDDYADLGEGLWIVATDPQQSFAQAERRASRLDERYPGAYATRLEPAPAS